MGYLPRRPATVCHGVGIAQIRSLGASAAPWWCGPGALDVHRAALTPFYAAARDDGCKRFLLASTRPTILRSILKRYGSVPAVACRCLPSGRIRGNTGTLRPPAVDAGGRGEGNGSVG